MPKTATADDLPFEEWKECRATIGRLDQILEDLRKFGFSIITGLLTAGAFLGNSATASPDLSAAVFITVMVLVAALFSVDTYYQVLLSGAVERALDLEAHMLPITVTKHLSDYAMKCRTTYMILALYMVLLATAEGMGLVAAKGLCNLHFARFGTWGIWRLVPYLGVFFYVAGIVVVVICVYRIRDPKIRRSVQALIGLQMVLPALTLVLTIYLLSFPVADAPGARPWIVTFGMFLALYTQFYWIYCAWQSGLHYQKQR